jgi:hypothetical protein
MNSYMNACRDLQNSPAVMWFTQSILVSLLIWLVHYVSGFLTVGSMVMVDLKVLGLTGKRRSLTEIADFYSPWMWTGIISLTVTGLLMLAGDAVLFCDNGWFALVLGVTALAAVTGVIIRRKASDWDRPEGTPFSAKFVALISLVLWLGTILSSVEVPSRSNVP